MATSNSPSRPHRRRGLPLKQGTGALKRLIRERKGRIRRGRTKRWAAALLSLALLAYAVSPLDLLPDTVPTFGWLDDLLLLPAGFWLVLRLLRRARQERRAYRLAKAGAEPPESLAERRHDSARTALLVAGATALALTLAYLAQQLWAG